MLTGGSGVIGPDANWLVGPVHNEEVILYADLDLAHTSRERYAMDIVGHYNRPTSSTSRWIGESDRRSRGLPTRVIRRPTRRPSRSVNESCPICGRLQVAPN